MSDIQVTRSSMPPLEEYVAEIAPLWESHWLTNMGEVHARFEAALAAYLGVPVENIALFVNGHQALECALEAFGLGAVRTVGGLVAGAIGAGAAAFPGAGSSAGGRTAGGRPRNKVVTTPFTFASTTHAIVRKGLVPMFADIKPDDCTIDPVSIERLMDDEVCAIVPVHVYGNLCDVDAIESIAARWGVPVIYDAAHAFGVSRNGVSAAAFGDASIFSFHATKVFNSIEGGAVVFRDPALKARLELCKDYGIVDEETCEYAGGNAKMNEFQAAMGICNLRHLDGEIARRRAVGERYAELLEGVPGVSLCVSQPGVLPNYAYMPVLFEPGEFGATRDDVFAALAAQGIHARKYFYPLASEFACYAGCFDATQTPVAKHVADCILCLPLYADLALEDVDRICGIVMRQRDR